MIAKSMLILSVIAIALGAITYNLMSSNVKQSGNISLIAQNSASEKRAISNEVTQVDMNGPFDLVITRSDQASLVVQGEERLLSRVLVQQEGKVLHITTKGMLVTMNQTLRITLALPGLTSLTQAGSGDTEVKGFAADDFSLNMTGSGDLNFSGQYQHMEIMNHGSGDLELDVGNGDRIDLNCGGSGNVEMVGRVKMFNAVLTGSGNIDAQKLIAAQAEVTVHGSGNMKVYASKEINVVSTGSGDVEVFGNPVRKVINKTGSGDVSMN